MGTSQIKYCEFCNKEFTPKYPTQRFCSRKCANKRTENKIIVFCNYCNKKLLRIPRDLKRNKSGLWFCNATCKNKFLNPLRYSTSVNSCEQELINILKKKNISFILHDRKILSGIELDIYIPDKNIAIEFNGPAHYKNIYGTEIFENTVLKDRKKIVFCYLKNINLIIANYLNLENVKQFLEQL